MFLINPNVGLVELIKRMIGTSNWLYKLYTSTPTLSPTTILSDLTELTGVSGYSPISQSASDFTLTGVAGNKGYAIAPPVTWTIIGGPVTIHGYFVTDSGGTILLAVAQFDTPFVISGTDLVTLVPVMGDSSRYIAA